MKKHGIIAMLVIVFTLFVVTASMASTLEEILERGSIIIGTDATYPPMEFYDDDGNLVGFDIDFARAIAAELGVEAVFIDTAWDGIFPALDTKKFDVIISATSITEERLLSKEMSDPYLFTSQAIAVRKDNDEIQGYDDLVGKTIAVQIGTTGDFAASEIEGTEMKRFDTIDRAYMEVMNQRADAVVNDYSEVLFRMEMLPEMHIVATFGEERYGVTMRQGDLDLLEAINDALAAIRESSVYDEMYEKWFGIN